MRWYEKPEVLSYIVSAYAGVDKGKRQFIWEDADGNVLIGNTRAFTDHLAVRFNLSRTETSWTAIHELMRALGEVARTYTARSQKLGKKFVNQLPVTRVIKRRSDK